MIRVRLTPGMLEAIAFVDLLACGVKYTDATPSGDTPIMGDADALTRTAAAFALVAHDLEGVKGKGKLRRSALAAAERCRAAIAHDVERRARPIHVSIPVDEQEAIAALALDPGATVAPHVLERLYRRTLAEESPAGWELTARGRAVADGTPPGDLVPFEHFEPGVAVKLAADLVLEDQEVPAGQIFHVLEARDRRLTVYDGALQIGPCHPLIFFVLRGEA